MATVEECKAIVADARKVFDAARTALNDAEAALREARNAESGIIGHVLEYTVHRGWGDKAKEIKRRLLVDGVKPGWNAGEMTAFGYLIVAGGKVGVRRVDVAVGKATDIGPYSEPK